MQSIVLLCLVRVVCRQRRYVELYGLPREDDPSAGMKFNETTRELTYGGQSYVSSLNFHPAHLRIITAKYRWKPFPD